MSGDYRHFEKPLTIKGSEYFLTIRPMVKGPSNGIQFSLSPRLDTGHYGPPVAVLNARVGSDEMFVVRIQVDELMQGKRLGSELLDQATDFCRLNGINELRLVATPESEAFYKKYFTGKRIEQSQKSGSTLTRLLDKSSVWTLNTAKVSELKLERESGRLDVFKPELKRQNAFCFAPVVPESRSSSSASPSPTPSPTPSSTSSSGGAGTGRTTPPSSPSPSPAG